MSPTYTRVPGGVLAQLIFNMSKEYMQSPETLLKLKGKAVHEVRWTSDERAYIERCLGAQGLPSVLAACCILSSQRPKDCKRSIDIIRQAIESKPLLPYVELSVYEALTRVSPRKYKSFIHSVYSFVEQSIAKRAINLNNLVVLLGILARAGDTRALALLQSLAHDSESDIRCNASLVLKGVGR